MIQAVSVLIFLIFLAYFFKKIKLIQPENGTLFAKLVTNFTLPALIFTAVSKHTISMNYLILAGIMIVSEILSAVLAWLIARILKLSKPATGALILASTFGSSAFLGYAIIKNIYHNNPGALASAAIVSELGVGLLIFTFGIFIAIHYGCSSLSSLEKRKTIVSFFYSPIFIALSLGLIVSLFKLPENNIILETVYKILYITGNANTVLVALTIGVLLEFKNIRKAFVVALAACAVKLLFQPFIASVQTDLLSMNEMWKQIIVIETSMPSATLAAVFAEKYGCDAELTSILVFATFISSLFTMITVFLFLS
jgi:predicted permease